MNSGISYTNAVASTSTAFCPPSRRLPSSSAAPLPGALDSLPSSTDVAATSQLSSASQSLARAKDVVAALLTAADSRPSRRKVPGAAPGVGACDPCRRIKSKCDGENGATCGRCKGSGADCSYSAYGKRGRKKGPTSTTTLLQDAYSLIEDALHSLEVTPQPPTSPPLDLPFQFDAVLAPLAQNQNISALEPQAYQLVSSGVPVSRPEPPVVGVEGLGTPLEILAHYSSTAVLLDYPHPAAPRPDRYFGSDLNPTHPDTDLSLDPVNLGLLTLADFERLLDLYFTHLRPFFWHLNSALHTSTYLRSESPFLSTAICATAAMFCPLSGDILQPLSDHAVKLSVRVFTGGYKSVEIVQAFCFMTHWASPVESWSKDRSWGWLGQAIRIATEIQLDKEMDRSKGQALSAEMLGLLDADAARTWQLVYTAEISHTGRSGSLNAYTAVRGVPETLVADPLDPEYNLHATVSLRRILSRALDRAPSSFYNDRDTFTSLWKAELDSWQAVYKYPPQFVQIIFYNTQIIAMLFSLRFPGPSRPVLQECRRVAATVASLAVSWPNPSFRYASNFVAINMAYGGTLLLRLIRMEISDDDEVDEAAAIALCRNVADTLKIIGQAQLHRASLASHLSARLHKLIGHIRSTQHSAVGSPTQAAYPLDFGDDAGVPSMDLTSGWNGADLGYDFSALFSFDQYTGEAADDFLAEAGGWLGGEGDTAAGW